MTASLSVCGVEGKAVDSHPIDGALLQSHQSNRPRARGNNTQRKKESSTEQSSAAEGLHDGRRRDTLRRLVVLQPLAQPAEDAGVPLQRVLRLQDPVAFVGEIQEFRRDFATL